MKTKRKRGKHFTEGVPAKCRELENQLPVKREYWLKNGDGIDN